MFNVREIFQLESPTGQTVSVRAWWFPGGKTRGSPTITFLAGLHGDEPAGVAACLMLLRDLQMLHGSDLLFDYNVRIIPCANPFAMLVDERRSPIDHADWNRVRRSSVGDLGERVAFAIGDEILKNRGELDVVIDVHGGNRLIRRIPEAVIFRHSPLSPQQRSLSLELALKLGLPLIRDEESSDLSPFKHTLLYQLACEGLTPLVIELGGGGGRVYASETRRVAGALANLVSGAAKSRQTPSSASAIPVRLYRAGRLLAVPSPCAGLFLAEYTSLYQGFGSGPLGDDEGLLEGFAEIVQDLHMLPDERFKTMVERLRTPWELLLMIRHAVEAQQHLVFAPNPLRVGAFRFGDLHVVRRSTRLGKILGIHDGTVNEVELPKGLSGAARLIGIRRHPLVYEGSELALLIRSWEEVGHTEPFV